MNYKDSLLQQLTLIIPTYGRQAFALRNMKYWSGRGPQVIILDGTENPIPGRELSSLSINIHYNHIPDSFYQRVRAVRKMIKTPYVSLLGDDEFHLPEGLIASIDNLNKDPGLVACMGRALGFTIAGNKKSIIGYPVYPELEDYKITSEDIGRRMFDHMNHYTPSTMYAVIRKREFLNTLEVFLKHEFPVNAITELQFELSVCYLGKSKILPVLHWLRSAEIGPVLDSPDIYLKCQNLFHEWWPSPDKIEFREHFLNVTSIALAETDGRDPQIVSKEIELAMDAYSSLCINELECEFRNSSGKANLSTILKSKAKQQIINNRLTFLIRLYHIIKNICFNKTQTQLLIAARELGKTGVNVNFKELIEIENFVLDFHRQGSENSYQTNTRISI